MASYNQSGGSGQDRNMETLWQQLRGQSQTMSSDDNQHPPAHEYQPQSYNAGHFNLPPYSQGPGSQDMDYSDDIMPPAPTPPVGNIPPGVLSFMNSGGSSIGAPRAPPASSSKSEHAANLLNLLKFQQPPVPPVPRDAVPITSSGYQPRIVAPAPPAQEPSGLLAAMMKGSHMDSPSHEAHAPAYNKAASPPSDTHSYLLDLLSRPKPAQNEHQQPQTQQFHESAKSSQSITLTPQSTNDSMNEYPREHRPQPLPDAFHGTSPTYSRPPADYSQSYGSGTASSPHVAPNAASYTDPFADAHASSPPDKTPKSSSIPPATGSQQHSPVQMLKKPSATSSPHSAVVDMRQPSERSFVPSPEQARHEEVDEMEDTQAKPQPAEPPAAENKETVAEAVSDLAEKVDREAQEALARAEQQQVEPETANVDAQLPEEQPEEEVPAAEEPPKEDEPAQDHPDEAVPRVVDASQAPVPEDWEIPEAEAETIVVIEEESDAIPVYNFPMKPWIALKLRDDAEMQKPTFRQESWFDITRLKKEFDQIDRNLVTASENHIVYGMSKAGGLRVIRQDDGKDVKLFTDTQDRIFNVSISVSPADNPPVKEAIIGTGISGTVYWTLTMDGDEDHTLDNHPEQYGFALPPINSQDGDAPGGVLKTRARPSSMHPEYFAIGRGKTINIIWPSLIMQGNLFHPGHDRTVDVDKLTKQCSLKINTGKAGKDFTFSADDSTIVTLDKSGKVKFWDIRDLTAGTMDDSHTFLPENTNLEIREPILSLNTTPDEAKPWPTSVLLVDKPRPYQRRTAQRYMIVGTKQNHAFQLWDLTLRKVVQEISLPHSKESDAVCSLMYHAATGMIIIGHPTRNSVYFLHLSAPKYNLKITQVEYMTRLATPESYIPMPESTAVLSGFREISFSHVGELRSLDLLPTPANVDDSEEEPVLFELYGMHSKGVCYVQVRQRDLGWTSDNRVQKPVDAIAADVVSISKISSPAQPPLGGEGASGMAVVDSGATQIPIRVITRPKDAPAEDSNSNTSRRGPEAVIAPPKVNLTPEAPADKPEKPKGRKKKGPASDFDKSNNSNLPRAVNNKPADSSKNVMAPQPAQISQEAMEKLEARIADRIGNSVQSGFQVLNTRIEEMADARDRAFDERQQEILRTVSQRLTENTQQLLVQTVQQEFDRRLLPTITDQTSRAVSEHLNLRMSAQVSQAVQKELAKTVPSAIAQSLQKPETVSYIAQMMSDSVLRQLHERVQHDLTTNIFPAFHNMASEAVQRSQGEYERKLNAATEHLQAKLREESGKVDQLTTQVQRLQETLSAMASAQSKFQDKILKGQRNLASPQGSTSSQVAPYQPHTQMPAPPPVDPVVDQVNKTISAIADLMRQEQYETAIVRWLQSDRLNDVFDAYFSTISPGFLAQVAPLVQLSVCATISENIKEGRVRERIVWLETLLQSFGATIDTTMDDQVREITPKIMGIVNTRLEGLFMSVSNQAPEDPMLKVLSDLIRRCNDIARETKKPSPSNHSDHHPQHMGGHHHMMQGPPQHGEQYPGQAMQTHHYNMNMY